MANRDFKIHALCLLTMLLQNLRPSISNLSPILTWVSSDNIQISSPCVGDVVSGIDGVTDRAHCDQVTLQSRASFLSFRESVSPTLSWPQLKCYGVGLFPSSNGVHRFFTGTSLFRYDIIWVSQMNLSNSGIGNQFRTWDPGVIDCDSTVCVMKLRMHQLDHKLIQILKSIIDIVKFWRHDLINIGWILWLWNASARQTVEYMHKMGMGNCVNGRIRNDFISIRRHKSDLINKNIFVEIHGQRVTRRKTAARTRLNFTRLHERSLALMLGGEEDDGFVFLLFSNGNGLHQYWSSPPLQLLIFNNFNPSRNTNGLFGFKICVKSSLIDDDVDCVVGSNASLVVSSTEVIMDMLLCQGLCFSRVRVRDFLESGKAIFSKDAIVEPILTTVNLFVIMLKKITKSSFLGKTLVRKLWYHRVYISELFMDTSGVKLRFAKRKFSHKLLHANRNQEKSNMKLDNNGSYGRLASKTTLRKASSISLLLYFS